MAKKSAIRIEKDIYDVLVNALSGIIGGTVYKEGCRPLNATTEDAVVIVSGGDAEQIQTGRAHVNIYVPDIDNGNGNFVEDKERLTELSDHDATIVEALNECLFEEYSFRLYSMTETFSEPDIHQNFVNVNLEFDRITF